MRCGSIYRALGDAPGGLSIDSGTWVLTCLSSEIIYSVA